MRNKTNHTPLTRGSRLTDAKLLLIITICVFVVMYLCAVLFLGSGFKKPQTFFNILNENAALLILSCGMSLVMITGGIDISVGTLTALVCMSCAVNLDFHGGTVLTAILLALGIGTAFGLVQGFLIAYLEIQPFIVTLAGMFFAKGMTTIVNATQFNVENEAFKALKETRIYVPGMGSVNKLGAYVPAYVEIGVVVALVVVAVLFVVLRWTRFGRSVYAVGGNSYSANMLAINVKRTKFLAHLICGILAGIGGFVYFLHVGVARQRRGDERHRGLYHRRHDAHRRRRQHHRHIFRRSVAQHDQKYRFFPRFGRSMVDKYHGSWYDMLVPCNSKSGPFPQK